MQYKYSIFPGHCYTLSNAGVMVYKFKVTHFTVLIFRVTIVFSLIILIALENETSPLKQATAATISSTLLSVEGLNKQQKYETSINVLLHALSLHPNSKSIIIAFKQTFTLHLYNQVSTNFKRLALDKHDTEAYLAIARSYNLMGDPTKAMETLLDGVIDNPNFVHLWTTIAAMELQAHREVEALSVFKEIIRIDLKNGTAHNNIAYILAYSRDERIHNLKSALYYAQEAISLEPSNPNYLDTLAVIKFQLGQKKEALSLINQAISLSPHEDYFKQQLSKFQSSNSDSEFYQKASLVK